MPDPTAATPREPRNDGDSPPGEARPGERIGLPAQGRGAVAPWGRRILGLAVDWAVSLLVSAAFVEDALGRQFGPLAVFAVMHVVLVGTAGFTLGHFVAGVVVRGLDGRPVGVLRALIRTGLLCLVIPPVIYDTDRRGLHDKAAETVVVRR